MEERALASARIAVNYRQRGESVTDPDSADAAEQIADEFGCAITSITVESGQELPLSAGGSVIAVVGANNVGKSTLLREIKELVHRHPGYAPQRARFSKDCGFAGEATSPPWSSGYCCRTSTILPKQNINC
jgi:hypothetical protein